MAVEGYDGYFGSGKTASAIAALWRAKCRGRRVFANVPLVDRRTRRTREFFFFGRLSITPARIPTYGKSWADGPILQQVMDLAELDNCVCLVDEAELWMNNRKWAELPDPVQVSLNQQRKDGYDLIWTAPRSSRIDKTLRDITHTLWTCEKYGPISHQRAVDPYARKDLGYRLRWLGPYIWELYDTEFKVGDGRTVAGGYGKTDRYKKPGEELVRRAALNRLPAYARMDRIEDEYGNVSYVRGGQAEEWWLRHDQGEDVGPSPLVVREPRRASTSGGESLIIETAVAAANDELVTGESGSEIRNPLDGIVSEVVSQPGAAARLAGLGEGDLERLQLLAKNLGLVPM